VSMKIGRFDIGIGQKPFVIAEMSANHNGSLERALDIVDAIATTGAQALKLQTYTADTMTIDFAEREFFISDPKSLWHGKSLYELYQEAYTPWEWHEPIFRRAEAHGMVAFSTPFDASAVDFLESLGVPAYKVASFENTDLELIRRVASTGKPIIISTGMANVAEIYDAAEAARGAGCCELALLKCTSSYPADPSASNLAAIPLMRQLFGCEIGLSDHTLGIGAAVASVALGATIIEKHVTLRRSDGGVDSAFSMEPAELAQLVAECNVGQRAIGVGCIGPSEAEQSSRVFRRTLYVVEDIAAGSELTPRNLRAIRPGLGLAAGRISEVMGKRVGRAVRRGTPFSWELLSEV
jgi:pseudaminic acid synthase